MSRNLRLSWSGWSAFYSWHLPTKACDSSDQCNLVSHNLEWEFGCIDQPLSLDGWMDGWMNPRSQAARKQSKRLIFLLFTYYTWEYHYVNTQKVLTCARYVVFALIAVPCWVFMVKPPKKSPPRTCPKLKAFIDHKTTAIFPLNCSVSRRQTNKAQMVRNSAQFINGGHRPPTVHPKVKQCSACVLMFGKSPKKPWKWRELHFNCFTQESL